MTLTSWSLGPSQCSSCGKTSRPLLTALTLAVLARSRPSRLGLQEGQPGPLLRRRHIHCYTLKTYLKIKTAAHQEGLPKESIFWTKIIWTASWLYT